jgi:hypothetical protein
LSQPGTPEASQQALGLEVGGAGKLLAVIVLYEFVHGFSWGRMWVEQRAGVAHRGPGHDH